MLKAFSLLFLCCVCLTGSLVFGQEIHLPPSVRQGPTTSNIPVRTEEQVDRERAQKANELLQMEIKRDTEKLFTLSSELKDFVDQHSQGVLSLDAAKKAEQIEKLAKSLKSKIKQSY
jgi:hypothetical protein